MKKICFILNSSGSLSVVYPIIKILENYKIIFYVLYSDQLKKNRILSQIKTKKIYLKSRISQKKCKSYLKRINPKLVYCGNNGNNEFELNFLKSAKLNKFKTFTLMDSWTYPLRRFQIRDKNNFEYIFPDVIGVPDISIRNKINKISDTKTFVVGYPQFNFNVFKYYQKKRQEINKLTNFLYVSTPYEKPKKKYIYDGSEIFFDQKKIVNTLLNVLNTYFEKKQKKTFITFRLHPLEKKNFRSYLIKIAKKYKNLIFYFDKKIHNYESYLNKNAVFGISSMMLLEASKCGLPSISLQLDREFTKKGKKNFFKNIKGVKVCSNINELKKELNKLKAGNNVKIIKHKIMKKNFLNKNLNIAKQILKEI